MGILETQLFVRFLAISQYSGTPPYDHPVYKTTSLLRPFSFKPSIKNIDSFYYFEDPVNATTSLLRPGFYGPTVVALTGFHCTLFRTQVIIQKFIRWIKGLHSFQEPKFLSLFHILANSQLSISQSSLYTGLHFSCRISKRAHKHDIFEFMHPRGKCVRLH